MFSGTDSNITIPKSIPRLDVQSHDKTPISNRQRPKPRSKNTPPTLKPQTKK